MNWYNLAFKKQTDRLKPLQQEPITTDLPKIQIPTPMARTILDKKSSNLEDSEKEDSAQEEEDYQQYLLQQQELQQYQKDHEAQYRIYCDHYHQLNPDPHIIPLVPKEIFQANLFTTIERFRHLYLNNCIYEGESRKQWEPSDQGPLLAILTVQCCDLNILDSQFSYRKYLANYDRAPSDRKMQIIALSITYNCLKMLENYTSYLDPSSSDSESLTSSSNPSFPDSGQDGLPQPELEISEVTEDEHSATLLGASDIRGTLTVPHGQGVGQNETGSGQEHNIELFQSNLEQTILNRTNQFCADISDVLDSTNLAWVRTTVTRFSHEMDSIITDVRRNLTFNIQNSCAVRASVRRETELTECLAGQVGRVHERQYAIVEWLGQIEKAMTIDTDSKRVKFLRVSTQSSLDSYISTDSQEPQRTAILPRERAISRPISALTVVTPPRATVEPSATTNSIPLEQRPELNESVPATEDSSVVTLTESQAERNNDLLDISQIENQECKSLEGLTLSQRLSARYNRIQTLVKAMETNTNRLKTPIIKFAKRLFSSTTKSEATINQSIKMPSSVPASETQPSISMFQRPSDVNSDGNSLQVSSQTISSPSTFHSEESRVETERLNTNDVEPYFTDQPHLNAVNIGGYSLRTCCPHCPFPIASCHCLCSLCGEWTSKCICER